MDILFLYVGQTEVETSAAAFVVPFLLLFLHFLPAEPNIIISYFFIREPLDKIKLVLQNLRYFIAQIAAVFLSVLILPIVDLDHKVFAQNSSVDATSINTKIHNGVEVLHIFGDEVVVDLFGELFSLGLGQYVQRVDYCYDILFVSDGVQWVRFISCRIFWFRFFSNIFLSFRNSFIFFF